MMAGALAALPTLVLVLMLMLSPSSPSATASSAFTDVSAPDFDKPARAPTAQELKTERVKGAPSWRTAVPKKARTTTNTSKPNTKPNTKASKSAQEDPADEEEIAPVEDEPEEKGPGTLVVVVLGGSCALSVDGASQGTRSSVSTKVPAGPHTVSCTPKGKTPRTRRINVPPGKKGVALFKL
jgi:hypothetical protein